MKRGRAFSLVEVVVVIAIILVLAAILVPVGKRAVLSAKEAKASSGLRAKDLSLGTSLHPKGSRSSNLK